MDEQHRESIGMVDKNGREIFVGDTLKVEELKLASLTTRQKVFFTFLKKQAMIIC